MAETMKAVTLLTETMVSVTPITTEDPIDIKVMMEAAANLDHSLSALCEQNKVIFENKIEHAMTAPQSGEVEELVVAQALNRAHDNLAKTNAKLLRIRVMLGETTLSINNFYDEKLFKLYVQNEKLLKDIKRLQKAQRAAMLIGDERLARRVVDKKAIKILDMHLASAYEQAKMLKNEEKARLQNNRVLEKASEPEKPTNNSPRRGRSSS